MPTTAKLHSQHPGTGNVFAELMLPSINIYYTYGVLAVFLSRFYQNFTVSIKILTLKTSFITGLWMHKPEMTNVKTNNSMSEAANLLHRKKLID